MGSIARADPSGYKALYSESEDITLGTHSVGLGAVVRPCTSNSSGLRRIIETGIPTAFEEIVHSVGPEVAYTVEIERFRSKVGGRDDLSDLALRVTCVYRRDADGWRLVHRHADPRVDRLPAESVLHD